MSRANGKGNIFETDVDRLDFVKSLAETCIKADFQVHAYCLMHIPLLQEYNVEMSGLIGGQLLP